MTVRSGWAAQTPAWPPAWTRTDPRSRARATSRRWTVGVTGAVGWTRTTSTASSRAATVPAHSCGPGSAISRVRPSTTPSSAAASRPRWATPTTAHQAPSAVAGPARARARLVAALPGEGKDALVALFEIGADTTSLKVLRDDEMLYDRDQAFGGSQLTQLISRQYGFSFEEAEAKKLGGDLPGVPPGIRPSRRGHGAKNPSS